MVQKFEFRELELKDAYAIQPFSPRITGAA